MARNRRKIISGIDLGSNYIRIAVGQVRPEGVLDIIGVAETHSEGISKGEITDIEDAVSSISACLEQIEKVIGLPIQDIFAGVSGTHIISQESRGVVSIARADGAVKDDDVSRVLEAAQTVATPANYEILHILPRSFSIDNQPGIIDPVGMTGTRLEVDAQVILGLTNQIKNLTKCFARTGIKVNELVVNPLATAEAVLDKRQKELGVLLVNIGNTTTNIAVFEEGNILSVKIIPLGSRYITTDVAIGLRVPIDLAEMIKVNYGTALPLSMVKSEKIDFADLDQRERGSTSKKEVSKIIRGRCEKIFKLIDEELALIGRKGKLPAGIVLTGAGSKLEGLTDVAKSVFKVPASLGSSRGFVSGNNKALDISFATAVGLVIWGMKRPNQKEARGQRGFSYKGKGLKSLFKNLFSY
ncbi:cell division protein FtsA [bacterium]|nr:cell division protein FtsA [bacterium]